jgi:hypothetical protein
MKNVLIKSLALLCAFAATASAAVVIKDFQGSGTFDYDYLSWLNQPVPTATGIEVGGTATASGGAGGFFSALSLTGYTDLVVSAKLLPGNAATGFNVVLFSAPGVSSAYQFSTSTLNSGYQSLSTSLLTPFFTVGGGANLAAINQFEIQGNFDGSTALGLGFSTITAVPEPSTIMAALGLTGLMLWPAGRRLFRMAGRSRTV